MKHSAQRSALVRCALLAACGLGLLAGLGLLDLMTGVPRLSAGAVWEIARGGGSPLMRVVVLELRLPRFVLGILAGGMLALSGALLQDALRNPLAGPELLGVTSGATVVVAAITILHLSVLLGAVPWLALAGGLAGSGVVILGMRGTRDPVRLVLCGAALTALLNAGVIILMSFGNQNDISLLFLFLVGSLANRTWAYVGVVLPWALAGIPLGIACARALNVLRLGDDVAQGLGLRVFRLRLFIIVLGAMLVAAVVAVSGPISFVALLSPHLARRLLRTSDTRFVLPASVILGAVLLTAADALARQVFSPQELPVGIFTTLVGGPLLLYLLRRRLATSESAV